MRPFFYFKQFYLTDEHCGMKIGTDAVLLGAWAQISSKGKILDIGTGCGILALMLAQKTEGNQILAIEIDTQATETALKNVKNSPWAERITIINKELKAFAQVTDEKYDYIICNPPFFQNNYTPSDDKTCLAKHNTALTYEALAFYASKLLSENGTFSVIIPHREKDNFKKLCKLNGIFPLKETAIVSKEGKQPNRVLLMFAKGKSNTDYCSITIREENGSFTEEYKYLVKDYLLDIP